MSKFVYWIFSFRLKGGINIGRGFMAKIGAEDQSSVYQ
jgi:hypothetical protein